MQSTQHSFCFSKKIIETQNTICQKSTYFLKAINAFNNLAANSNLSIVWNTGKHKQDSIMWKYLRVVFIYVIWNAGQGQTSG